MAFTQMVTEDLGGRWSSANPGKSSRVSFGPYQHQWVHSVMGPGAGAGLRLQVGTTGISCSGEVSGKDSFSGPHEFACRESDGSCFYKSWLYS